jgi:hypothetical protein
MQFQRFAIYYVPNGAFHDIGSAWLGWDNRASRNISQSDVQNAHTRRPQKYGFHATIKAPFRLSAGCTSDDLVDALGRFCASRSAIDLGAFEIKTLGRFLALTPTTSSPQITDLAAEVVRQMDPFRAALSADDIARRRKTRLTPEQDALMLQWGYPFVFDHFKFHMTLTGPLPDDLRPDVAHQARERFAPYLGSCATLDSLSVMGEDENGRFHVVETISLGASDTPQK